MALPSTWAEVYERLSCVLDAGDPEAAEWIREALEASYGVLDPSELPRGRRGLVLQKLSGVLLELEGRDDDLAFAYGRRGQVAAVFARYFGGTMLPGPPWRLDPSEETFPSYEDWSASLGFE